MATAGDTNWHVGARINLSEDTGTTLCELGLRLRTTASDRHELTAAAHLTQMAGDLTLGALLALRAERLYSSAALSRQLLEIADLLDYFHQKPDRASIWVTGSDDDLREKLRPAVIRKELGASGKTYDHHCKLGGHPRPAGALLLVPGSSWSREDDLELTGHLGTVQASLRDIASSDLLQHLRLLFASVVESAPLAGMEDQVGVVDEIMSRLVSWHQHDPLARVGAQK